MDLRMNVIRLVAFYFLKPPLGHFVYLKFEGH